MYFDSAFDGLPFKLFPAVFDEKLLFSEQELPKGRLSFVFIRFWYVGMNVRMTYFKTEATVSPFGSLIISDRGWSCELARNCD